MGSAESSLEPFAARPFVGIHRALFWNISVDMCCGEKEKKNCWLKFGLAGQT